jgi:hypothetical protein
MSTSNLSTSLRTYNDTQRKGTAGSEKGRKAFETCNVEIHTTYLSPKYTLSKQAASQITSTGQLNVFELNPLREGPSFKARWDGGNRASGKPERNDLDIDIYGVSDEERCRFENGQGAYSGHRNKAAADKTGRVYHVFLRTPNEMIFEGTVSFNLLRKLGFEASLQPKATLDTKVIRAKD